MTDDVCTVLRRCILEEYKFDPGKEHVRDAAVALCIENTYHPVRDYLDGLAWDKGPRLATWLNRYLGCEDNPLNAAIGAIMLVAAVRRVRQPGVKFDTIVVFEGVQGAGKSTALRLLAGADNFSDQDILSLDGKSQMEQIEGVWIYEICELEGISRADTNKVKAFASRSVDRARPAYGRFREDRPRQAIFVGTTNDDQYLRDPTGNRRFWPVPTGAIDLDQISRDRDQLWAEAAALEAAGYSIVLPEELWPVAREQQQEREEDDPWRERLAGVNGERAGDSMRVSSYVLMGDWLQIPPENQKQYHSKRLASVMRKLGWIGPKNLKTDKGRVLRGYERPFDPSRDGADEVYPTY